MTDFLSAAIEDQDLGAHSLLGASGAHRWMNCPGSFALSRQVPARPPSVHANKGTLAHRYIEEIVSGYQAGTNQLILSDDEVGSIHQVGIHAIEVDQDLVDGVNLMLDYVAQRVARGLPLKAEFQVVLDSYFQASAFRPPVRMYGRVDLALIDAPARLLEIVDFKNGIGILVDPRDNPQLLYYAAGVLAQVPTGLLVTQVQLTVVQPHARTPEKIRSWVIDTLDLLMWIDDQLIPAVQACTQPDAPLVLGPWCRFCPAAFACPRLAEEANRMAAKEFSPDGISMPGDPEKLAEYLTVAEHAETWITALRLYAIDQLKAQMRIPGWSLGPTRPVRRWTDDKRAGELLLKGGFTLDQAYQMDLRSPAQIEKLLKNKRDFWSHTLAPLVESHSSGVKLVHSDIAADFPEEG